MDELLKTYIKEAYTFVEKNHKDLQLEGYMNSCNYCEYARYCHEECEEESCDSYCDSQYNVYSKYIIEYMEENHKEISKDVYETKEFVKYVYDLLGLDYLEE